MNIDVVLKERWPHAELALCRPYTNLTPCVRLWGFGCIGFHGKKHQLVPPPYLGEARKLLEERFPELPGIEEIIATINTALEGKNGAQHHGVSFQNGGFIILGLEVDRQTPTAA